MLFARNTTLLKCVAILNAIRHGARQVHHRDITVMSSIAFATQNASFNNAHSRNANKPKQSIPGCDNLAFFTVTSARDTDSAQADDLKVGQC